jgi:hypothetical protein
MIVPNEIKDDLKETYTQKFFNIHKQYLPSYKKLAEYLKNKVTSITDYGCGHGLLVECLINENVDAYGLEGSDSAKEIWNKENFNKYQIYDFTKDDNIYIIPKTEYVISTEVAEHLDKKYAEKFIKNLLVNDPKLVFFGAATVFQDRGQNPSHINEQPFMYWVNLFNNYGYDIDLKETYELKRFFGENIKLFINCWWYPKNMFVFKKKLEIILDFLNITDITYIPKLNPEDNIFNILITRDRHEYTSIILYKYIEYIKTIK